MEIYTALLIGWVAGIMFSIFINVMMEQIRSHRRLVAQLKLVAEVKEEIKERLNYFDQHDMSARQHALFDEAIEKLG